MQPPSIFNSLDGRPWPTIDFGPVVTIGHMAYSHDVLIFRRSVLEAFVPKMSRLSAAGDVRGMLELNSRGNVLVSTLLYPALAFVFAFAEDLVTLVYTAAYLEDTWQADPRVKFDGGLRWELMWVGTTLHFSNELAPRFGVSWDPLGGGRSRVWSSAGRSFAMLPAGLGSTILSRDRTARLRAIPRRGPRRHRLRCDKSRQRSAPRYYGALEGAWSAPLCSRCHPRS